MKRYDPLTSITNGFIIINYSLGLTLLVAILFFGWNNQTLESAIIVFFFLIINLIVDILFNKRIKK